MKHGCLLVPAVSCVAAQSLKCLWDATVTVGKAPSPQPAPLVVTRPTSRSSFTGAGAYVCREETINMIGGELDR